MQRALVLMILASLSTGPARAACDQWQWTDNNTFIQANGFRSNVGISLQDGKLYASAVYEVVERTSDGNVGHGVYGGGDVTAQGKHLYVTIAWNNGTTGIYEGDIGADGRLYGLTWNARSPATKVKWYSEKPIECAAAPAKPPADVLGAHSGTRYHSLGKKKVPATSQAPSPPLMAGTFETSFGLLQLGPTDGTYSHENGRVTVENTHDNIVEGTWEQNTAGRQCPDGRYRGTFVFAFAANSFTGFYGYCDDPPTAGAWNGTRR